MFALQLESRYNLSQEATNSVIQSTSQLINDNTKEICGWVKGKLVEQGVDPSFLEDIPIQKPFNNLETQRCRDTQYAKLPTYVKPKQIVLRNVLTRKRKKFVFLKRSGAYIPFKDSLSVLINMPEVWHSVLNPHFTEDDVKREHCRCCLLHWGRSLQVLFIKSHWFSGGVEWPVVKP